MNRNFTKFKLKNKKKHEKENINQFDQEKNQLINLSHPKKETISFLIKYANSTRFIKCKSSFFIFNKN